MAVDATDTTSDPNATMVNKLKEWVNARYRAIVGKRSWNFRIKDYEVQTVTDITTGTVSATNASTTITFSSAPTPSVAGRFIQFSDSDDWYEISAHTAGQTGATLVSEYQGSTNASLTYTVRKVYYSLDSALEKVLSVKQTRDDYELKYLTPRQMDELVPDRTRTGEPEFYSLVGLDSSNQWRVEFYPTPNVNMNISFRGYASATEMSADGDTPILPASFHDYIVWDVLATYGYLFLDDTRVSEAKANKKELLKDMIANDVASGAIVKRRPYDTITPSKDDFLRRLDLPIQ